MSLSTKNLPETSGNKPKTMNPGNQEARIYDIALVEGYEHAKNGSYHIILKLEGVDEGPEFEGFFIDEEAKSGPRFKGQVGKVKMSQWAFEDGETKTGYKVNRDNSILKALKNLATVLGKSAELDNVEAVTIEEFVPKAARVLKGNKFIKWCLGGREYDNKEGYVNHDLFLPKPLKTGERDDKGKDIFNFPYEDKGVDPSRLITFDASLHIVKNKKAKPAEENFEVASPAKFNDFDM